MDTIGLLQFLDSRIDERRKQMQMTVASGAAKDYSEYQRICGVISGLDFASHEIKDLAKRLENNDE